MLPGRRNSQGADLADEATLVALAAGLAAASRPRAAAPLLAHPNGGPASGPVDIRNPADRDDVVGTVIEAAAGDVAHAVAVALDEGRAWSETTPAARAACLERAADLLEAERVTLLALAVREAGKTVANAISEVREAADFLRYYAAQARAELAAPGVAPIGPVVAISPWNFPLAIFIGEVAAALAAGNPVLAKPAEQTPLIAHEAVRILHRAGVPVAALQLLPGRGETVGAALVADPRVAGVIFTGSTEVARGIARVLAARDDDPVLIAETGGQNAMIVDSSALPEQVVADALASAFDSAGQRCSALRVLCVQDDVAPEMFAMLEGAMRELTLGDPRRLAVDVGPVIDADARSALVAHVARMRSAGLRVVEVPLPPECARGTFVAPTLVDLGGIDGLGHLEREVFGPVLHVLRWRRGELPALVDAINATGYGLTHGSPHAHRRDRRRDPRADQGGQRLRQSQYRRRRRRRAAFRRAPAVGHRTEGRGTALPAAAGAQRGDARCRHRQSRCPGRPASRTRSNSIRAASSCAWRATSARWSRRRRRRSRSVTAC